MTGDFSRHSFDPRRHFSGVLMQQGRVALDADWNELVSTIDRRLRAETVDIIGRCVVPRETPNGFEIAISGTGNGRKMTIGRGRAYVHGLLAENHGLAPFAFDMGVEKPDGSGAVGVLGEAIGSATVPYDSQPHFPAPEPLPDGNGPHLVYLDVWQREVSYLEDQGLLEKALGGVDTTVRRQTVWQVRVLGNVGAGVTCATPDAQIPGWLGRTRPSAGRLSTRTVEVDDPGTPCVIPPTAGYKGLENQLYRVEIHDGGAPGAAATFKWSRDNATVASEIEALPANDTLAVAMIGRDAVLRFNVNDWVEITDDIRELAGKPGEMRKVKGIQEDTLRITLSAALPADLIPSGVGPDTLAARHTRVRRWDQKGRVLDADGNLVFDLDAAASKGVIPVPAAGGSLILESGIQVAFDSEPAGGELRTGDYWCFAARTADASVERLDKAPPLGIHHHYCPLAVITFPDARTDCRVFWPPEVTGEGCGCSVCVTPELHNSGALTIQHAIDQVKQDGGTVCLDAGAYTLGDAPLRLEGAQSVRVRGQGWRTILTYAGQGPAVIVRDSWGVTAEEFSILVPPPAVIGNQIIGGGAGFAIRNSVAIGVERCVVVQFASRGQGDPGILLEGYLLGGRIRENALFTPSGIAAPANPEADDAPPYFLGFDLVLADNLLACRDQGILLGPLSLLFGRADLTGNTIWGCIAGSVAAAGAVAPGSRLEVASNVLYLQGDGIAIGTSNARLRDNDISAPQEGKAGDGILLLDGLDRAGIDHCQIIGNRITGVPGRGIAIRGLVREAMIKQNAIARTGRGGIVMEPESRADLLVVENNQLSEIAPDLNNEADPIAALRLASVERLQVVRNAIRAIAAQAIQSPSRAAVEVLGCRNVSIIGNDIVGVGPETAVGDSAAILVRFPFGAIQIADNTVRRSEDAPGDRGTDWYAVLVLPPSVDVKEGVLKAFTIYAVAGASTYTIDGLRVREVQAFANPHVNLQANDLVAWSVLSPVVRVSAGESCLFAGNHSLLQAGRSQVVAELAADRIVAANNIVRRLENDQDGMHLSAKVFTVLGNLTFGNIRVNGAALGPPWKDLNLLAQ